MDVKPVLQAARVGVPPLGDGALGALRPPMADRADGSTGDRAPADDGGSLHAAGSQENPGALSIHAHVEPVASPGGFHVPGP